MRGLAAQWMKNCFSHHIQPLRVCCDAICSLQCFSQLPAYCNWCCKGPASFLQSAACPDDIFDILHHLRGTVYHVWEILCFLRQNRVLCQTWELVLWSALDGVPEALTSCIWTPKKGEAITFWSVGNAKGLRICQHLLTIHGEWFFSGIVVPTGAFTWSGLAFGGYP